VGDYESGFKQGRIDALLEEHTARLDGINGNIERFAESNDALADEIRTVQEQLRIAAERVVVAASTLAAETERRREALATTDRTFDRRHAMAALVIAAAAVVLTYYLAQGR
jgi:secreted Zn-dependent insulinase-like peptidase